MAAIRIRQLTRRYGRRVGVERLCLEVADGELFGFLGPNGSGKTTTIRVMLGFLKCDEGGADIFGFDCWRDSVRVKRVVGYLPGDLRLYPWLTCSEAIRLFGLVRGEDLRKLGLELAEDFALDPHVRVRDMSRGMRQKLGLILALAHRPKLLVLDEPTAALDPLVQERLYAHLRELTASGHTVFFSSHALSEVERLCDRVAILREGKLVADETVETLRARAQRLVTIQWGTNVDSVRLTPPQCLDVFDRKAQQWRASLIGPVSELLAWCAGRPIDDLTIGQPDLNRLFQQYYTEGGTNTKTEAPADKQSHTDGKAHE